MANGKEATNSTSVGILPPSGPVSVADIPQGDVGGQKTLRTYWKNYFEKTDTLIWVVDATDRERLDDCRQELKGLLVQEVWFLAPPGATSARSLTCRSV